jgi:hypothetical protein
VTHQNSMSSSCPQCGAAEVVPIIYGFPGPQLVEEAERGEVALGECRVSDDDPKWCCQQCDYSGLDIRRTLCPGVTRARCGPAWNEAATGPKPFVNA